MARAASSDEDEKKTLIHKAVVSSETVPLNSTQLTSQATSLIPVHVAASRPAIKAYLSTILFFLATVALFAISTTAYLVFYFNYIPQVNLSRELYLQYGSGRHPHATAALSSSGSTLSSQQPYDISVELRLPRTDNNVAAGNFMIDLELLSSETYTSQLPSLGVLLPNTSSPNAITRSRRPTILPYTSRLTGLTTTILSLPLHLSGIRDLNTIILKIPMFERVTFARGHRNVPTAATVEVQSENRTIQVYSTKIIFEARFQGLRYLIYNHRFLSWAVFTTTFYALSFASMAIAWFAVSAYISPRIESRVAVRKGETRTADDHMSSQSNGHLKREIEPKPEEEEESLTLSAVSDTATTFPTLGRQMPLRFPVEQAASSPKIKQETAMEPLSQPITTGDVADDEDDEADDIRAPQEENVWRDRDRDRDSGIGTSMESEGLSAGLGLGLKRRVSGRRGDER